MKLNRNKATFGRHETFPLRYGWIPKGFEVLKADPEIFTQPDSDPLRSLRFCAAHPNERRFLRVAINGIPDSLIRQLMLGLALTVEQAGLSGALGDEIPVEHEY